MKPAMGDIIELTSPWDWGMMPVHSRGVLSSPADEGGGSITFGYSTPYKNGAYCSASGGPATIYTDLSEVEYVGTIKQLFWKFKGGRAKANNAEYFEETVRLWKLPGSKL